MSDDKSRIWTLLYSYSPEMSRFVVSGPPEGEKVSQEDDLDDAKDGKGDDLPKFPLRFELSNGGNE